MSDKTQEEYDFDSKMHNVYRLEDLAKLKTKPILSNISLAKDQGFYMCIFVVSIDEQSFINVASQMYENEKQFLLLVSEFISKSKLSNDMNSHEATDFFDKVLRFISVKGNAHMSFSFEKQH